MEEKSTKRILIDANRYEDVKAILQSLVDYKSILSYPVLAFVDENGETQYRADANSVRNEALSIMIMLQCDMYIKYTDRFSNLLTYVRSQCNLLLNNYAITISHGLEPKIDIDNIRNWLVLRSLIENLDNDWKIPEGWKKHIEKVVWHSEFKSALDEALKSVTLDQVEKHGKCIMIEEYINGVGQTVKAMVYAYNSRLYSVRYVEDVCSMFKDITVK